MRLSDFFSFMTEGGVITQLVFVWLSGYFILSVAIWVYRYIIVLSACIEKEEASLEMLLGGQINLSRSSLLCLASKRVGRISRETLEVSKNRALQEATAGLTWLAIVASTAPFIGLFGTVVEILEAFSKFEDNMVSLGVIAPLISKALIATAAGILTAIPAYSFHLLLKRKGYRLHLLLQMQIDLLISNLEAAERSDLGE